MTTVRIESFDELADLVQDEGLAVVQMHSLRTAAKWDRLTARTLEAIKDELRKRALGVYPGLSEDRHDEVRIYKIGTPLGNLIESVINPSEQGDRRLQEAATNSAQELIRQIRVLVCE
ncbi:MAG: hypothetical protein DCC49_09180 [Acidobacteria bacterium]|nr:MAG: hypothetical protein DCC49_09180 [Acidobacteriota bacterium]